MHRLIPATALLLLATGPALTETTAENAAKYRHSVMETMGGHVSALSMILRGQVEHDDHLLDHARALAAAGSQLKVLFPAGSGGDDTHALPAIWEEPERFAEAVAESKAATAALLEAVESGDKAAISKASRPVFMSCKGCHDRYRAEHDH